MAEARQRHEWAMACDIIASIINANGGDNGSTVKGSELNPFRRVAPPSPQRIKAEIATAREMWRSTVG